MSWLSNDNRVNRLEDRLNRIDVSGASGVAVLTVQVQELITQLAKHERDHEAEEATRHSNRRWLAGLLVDAITANAGALITLLLTHGH
jgi:hypothetical protein